MNHNVENTVYPTANTLISIWIPVFYIYIILWYLGDLRRDSKMGPRSDGTDSGESSRAESAEPPLSTEDILGAVEEAYPNSLTIDDMSRLDN